MTASFMRRCTSDDINWPDTAKFTMCPICKRETWRSRVDPATDEVLTVTEAETRVADHARETDESARRHEEFNQLYVEREAQKFRAELESFEGAT